MAVCDYCGTTYRGGAAAHGKLCFCTQQCRDHGRILEVLDEFPPKLIDAEIEKLRMGPCEECGANANIDLHKSPRVHSIVIWTKWQSLSHLCCQSCGRKHQWKAIGYSSTLGWWGIPFGLIITPIQIIRNFFAMMRRADRPSPDFVRIMRVHLAKRAAARRARA